MKQLNIRREVKLGLLALLAIIALFLLVISFTGKPDATKAAAFSDISDGGECFAAHQATGDTFKSTDDAVCGWEAWVMWFTATPNHWSMTSTPTTVVITTETRRPTDTPETPTSTPPVMTPTVQPTQPPTITVTVTETEVPTEQPTQEPTVAPTEPPVEQTPTPRPSKTPKPACNNGEGNGAEGCSPSDNGNNDEDDERPNESFFFEILFSLYRWYQSRKAKEMAKQRVYIK